MNKLEKQSAFGFTPSSKLYIILPAIYSMVKYSKNDLQQIFKKVLKVRTVVVLITLLQSS